MIVRVACSRCPRKGQYRLARLAERYGAELELPWVIHELAKDCELRKTLNISSRDQCRAHFPDIASGRPPDDPSSRQRTKFKIVA